ncbi:uncharacterized protein LOC100182681 [Ciona intestinalis]
MSCEVDHVAKANLSEDDPFDSIVMIENRMMEQGFKNGVEEGKLVGLKEGESLGKSKGAEVAKEIAFYLGFCTSTLFILNQTENMSKTQHKALTVLNNMQTMLCRLEHENVSMASVIENLEMTKSQFKQVTSLLRLKQTYAQSKHGSIGLSF